MIVNASQRIQESQRKKNEVIERGRKRGEGGGKRQERMRVAC